MTELCRYPITNTGLKNDLMIMVFYDNLTCVRKERRTHEKIKISWNIGSSCIDRRSHREGIDMHFLNPGADAV